MRPFTRPSARAALNHGYVTSISYTSRMPSTRPTSSSLPPAFNPPGTLQQLRHKAEKATDTTWSKPKKKATMPARFGESIPVPVASRDPQKIVLTSDMVPSLALLETNLPLTGCADLTPSQLHSAAHLYCDGAAFRDVTWAKKLVASSEGKITPYILHYLALTLHYGGHDMSLSVLNTAALLDYTPSILEMANIYSRLSENRGGLKRAAVHPVFSTSLNKFDALVSAGQNPDALALKAQMLSAQGQGEEAGKWHLKARRLGMKLYPGAYATPPTGPVRQPRWPRWLNEAECHVQAGRALLGIRKVEEARSAFAFAAFELDDAVGLAEYAKLLPSDAPEKRDFLMRAAVSGAPQAPAELGKIEMWLAARERLTEGERSWHRLVGREWVAVGNGTV